ncbi:ORF2 [Bovine adenovirus 6]|uniref:ORF2 n=1 Tax=Bovine adenovirus 6 TaxID=111167 RepID=K9MPD6_9ADEN|nr:ORF2 [Bovine adenovirus 6]AFV70658.1 ORF2 [Bovine adenovirus 6]
MKTTSGKAKVKLAMSRLVRYKKILIQISSGSNDTRVPPESYKTIKKSRSTTAQKKQANKEKIF